MVVIDRLEIIQIDEQHRLALTIGLIQTHGLTQALLELVTVQAAGQAVIGSQKGHLLGEPMPLADIVTDANEHALVIELEFADAQVQGEQITALAPPHQLPTDANDLALAGALVVMHVSVMADGIGAGHQYGDIAPQQLGLRITEAHQRGIIGRLDQPLSIHHQNGIHRGSKNGTGQR